ncbi:beta-ketoacyl synthase N-terminal-like domain-containing protein [Streptomyces sp. LX-29]|uniref:beta-ketoacyl synthase N-terminal-like domain-containing protein n=1 Tax=Streptomyces sp. LX-29 TaxID=2900152 RepID=UPI00240D7431|nr:beta-ketoacyl synthase N-terminal-like domain-containing protein [Streptomyces sp. LX-29]
MTGTTVTARTATDVGTGGAAAVFTGIGVAAPNGLGTASWWRATLNGESGIRPASRFYANGYPARLAGEVPGFPARPPRWSPRQEPERAVGLASVAAREALDDAGVDPVDLGGPYGAWAASRGAAGGLVLGQREPGAVGAGAGARNGPGDLVGALATGRVGGLDLTARARRTIRAGRRVVLTGGMDGAGCPWGWTAQLAGGRLSPAVDPTRAFLPFDSDARGYVAGEGGAILVLEAAETARERGARLYGELAGYAAVFDPRPGVRGSPGLRRAAELALEEAGVAVRRVDVVFADAAGVLALDLSEAEAISGLFGRYRVPVTAPKTMTGRLYAGGASLDLAAALLAIRDDVIPPTVHTTRPAPGVALDLVTTRPRPHPVRTVLILARGCVGYAAAAVVTAPRR